MKRKGNLYWKICTLDNISKAYDEVCSRLRNENVVENIKEHRATNIYNIYKTLSNKEYVPGKYHMFVIKEPKERNIVNQNPKDKIVNHLVSSQILKPVLFPCLIDQNVASRPNLGTSAGICFQHQYMQECKQKYGTYYILKCDLHHFFASINHQILKEKLEKKIKDKDALKIIFDIIDSNVQMDEKGKIIDRENGLYIGLMTSQYLAIFFLNDLDHFIKEELKIKYYVRYQDDFILLHPSKKYLKECLIKIKEFLTSEKLELNPTKTRIYKSTNNYAFLGRNIKGKYIKYRNVRRKLRRRKKDYQNELISLFSLMSSKNNYLGIIKKFNQNKTKNILHNNYFYLKYNFLHKFFN